MPAQFSSRRKFLLLTLGAGGAAALGWAGDSKDGASNAAKPELQTFVRTSWALGSDVSLTVLHTDSTVAERALNAAFVELNTIEDALSVYRSHSEISRLNQNGHLDNPSKHMLNVLEASQNTARGSNGAFDASVQPLWELYFDAQKKKLLPDAKAVESARAKVDYRQITFTPKRFEFGMPGMKITFNGIAQGYAADCVIAVLKSHGIEHALVDAGEFASEGHKADGGPFRVGIQHPRKPTELIGVCAMDGRALATSGDYATYFSDDFLYNHIFDPATGRSPLELASASILAPTGMMADALTKPVFILGVEKGMAFIESMPHCDAFLVTKDGKTFRTKGFPLV